MFCVIICTAVRVRPAYGYVYTHVRRVGSYLETLVYTHCMCLILFACIICVWFLPEFCVILPVLEHCFFNCYLMLLLYCGLCQSMSVLPTCLVRYLWYTKCAPREPIVRGLVSQTADGILGCGLSVSILRFPLRGVRPRGLNRTLEGQGLFVEPEWTPPPPKPLQIP